MASTREFAVSEVTGIPFKEMNLNPDVSGSRYLFDDWKPGIVILNNGDVFTNIRLKFDAVKSKFYFNRNDTIFELMDNVTEVVLSNTDDEMMDFRKIISSDGKNSVTTFARVLSSGKIPLYKEYSKKIEGENFTNGVLTSEKRMVPHNSLWTIINNETIPVKLNSRMLEELTADKKYEMQKFFKTAKINAKNEKDFAAAITYYNSISDAVKK